MSDASTHSDAQSVERRHDPHHNHRGHARVPIELHRRARLRAFGAGVVGGAALVLVYIATLALANSLEHAVTEFVRLRYWMVPLILGFAVQVGLFAYARLATRDNAAPHAHGVVASGGASTMSMVACCAHHLTDVLPLVGLAGAAVFFSEYQSLFLLVGVLSNVVGLVYLLGLLAKHGLYAPDTVAATLLKWPIDKAFPFVLAAALLIMLVATVLEVLS